MKFPDSAVMEMHEQLNNQGNKKKDQSLARIYTLSTEKVEF